MNRAMGGATWRLVGATAAWGLSFPTAKALMLMQGALVPGKPDWFHAAFVLWNRMFLASLVVGLIYRRKIAELGRKELCQGIELGVYGGVGMLLQTHAQNAVSASTSAFFTQFTCVFVPLLVAWRVRAWPSVPVVLSTCLVMTGCALLNGPQSGPWIFGRGEWETILAAAFFTGQIVCLEKPRYASNEMRSVAAVMFFTKSLLVMPLVIGGVWIVGEGEVSPRISMLTCFKTLYASGPLWVATAILTLFSTVYGYITMTRWQPLVSSVHAGLIYASEPVFATIWALFLPGFFSWLGAMAYANETLQVGFFQGASLVLAANVVILFARRTL